MVGTYGSTGHVWSLLYFLFLGCVCGRDMCQYWTCIALALEPIIVVFCFLFLPNTSISLKLKFCPSLSDASDFLPRRSGRTSHQKQAGYRTELGVFAHRPADWNAVEVVEFMKKQGFSEYAKTFQEYDINGQSMFLLREHHLLEKFEMKLGPTLRLLDTISRLRHPPN